MFYRLKLPDCLKIRINFPGSEGSKIKDPVELELSLCLNEVLSATLISRIRLLITAKNVFIKN